LIKTIPFFSLFFQVSFFKNNQNSLLIGTDIPKNGHYLRFVNTNSKSLMFKSFSLFTALTLGLTILTSSIQPVLAGETTCQGSLGAITVDNLRVPSGKTCSLNGTRIKGTLKVESSGILNAKGIRVVGNVQAEGANTVNINSNSTIGGSVQIKQGQKAAIAASSINGDLQFESNQSSLSATRNQIGGNLQAFQNKGGVSLSNNRIKGNLQCKENSPAPKGGQNTVEGSKEDQCSAL